MNGSCWEKANMGSGSSTAPFPSRHLEGSVMLLPSQVSDQESVHTQEEIAEAAKDRLRKSSYTSLQGLSCEFDHGVLFLRGKLPSFYCKQLAQAVVSGIEGVSRVVNETEVVL
jgi:osmotically-inducible protein OsmY